MPLKLALLSNALCLQIAALGSKEGAQILYCYSYRLHFIAQLSVYNWLCQVAFSHGPES